MKATEENSALSTHLRKFATHYDLSNLQPRFASHIDRPKLCNNLIKKVSQFLTVSIRLRVLSLEKSPLLPLQRVQ